MRNIILERELCRAIKYHYVVRLRYKLELYFRTFEPYIVFISTKDNILIGGTQTLDDSKRFEPAEPRMFEIDLISQLVVTKDCFKYDSRFNPMDKMYRNGTIYVIKPVKVVEQTA